MIRGNIFSLVYFATDPFWSVLLLFCKKRDDAPIRSRGKLDPAQVQ